MLPSRIHAEPFDAAELTVYRPKLYGGSVVCLCVTQVDEEEGKNTDFTAAKAIECKQ